MFNLSEMNPINLMTTLISIPAAAIFVYFFTISLFGMIKRKEIPAGDFAPVKKFAVLIAAHNENQVIKASIQSLQKMKYPKRLYDIFVIADNCTDNTAKIARDCGAIVYERYDAVKRGKGFALEWMFAKLFEKEEEYDAVCILDADNLVSANFLQEMNKQLCLGHEVVQGYLDSKNPNDTWVSAGNSIAFWVSSRLFQLPRHYLGLSCVLGGTGFITSIKVLKELGWGATCLTEDLEYTLKMVLKGKKVYWAHDAVIYDEKPLGLPQSYRQRVRWMQGHFDCARRFFLPLLKKAFADRDLVALDSALYMLQPVILVMSGITFVIGLANVVLQILAFDLYPLLVTGGFLYTFCLYLILERRMTWKNLKNILIFPFYNLTWVPCVIQGFMDVDKTEWVHTLHTRSMEITDLEPLEKVG